jgi:LysM repeat protein
MVAPFVVGGITIGRTLATKLGPKVVSKLKNMDKSKALNVINKVKNLKDKSITEFKRSFLKLPKTTVRQKEKFKPGTAQRRGLKRTDKGKLETQKKNQTGEIAPTKKTKQTVTVMDKKGRIKNISNRFAKTIGKSESRVAKRKRKRAIAKTAAGAALTLPFLGDKKETKAKDSSVKLTNYTIKKGDTLSEIAKRTPGATLGQIKNANKDIEDLNKITPGQKIKIPGEIKDRESVYQDVDMSKITMEKKVGGPLRPIPARNKGLPKLPKPVRNKMGFMKRGGKIQKRAGGGVALRGFGATRKI